MSKNCSTNTLWIEYHINISNSWANYIIVASLDRLRHSPFCLTSNSKPSCFTYASMYHMPGLQWFFKSNYQILLDFSFVVVVVFFLFCFVLLCFFGFFFGGGRIRDGDRVLLWSPGWPHTDNPASTSQVLIIYSFQTQNLWATNLDKLLNTSLLIRVIENSNRNIQTLSMGTQKIKK